MAFSNQEVSGRGCEDSSCDSLVNIDGINIGKIDGDKILKTEDITKILDNDKTKLKDVQTTNGADGVDDINNDKIKIKDLNVLLDGEDKAPKIEVLPDNVTVIKIKDFKILIPKK
jgi:argonaute-like protein implicated in RNA metabolism and viral defense